MANGASSSCVEGDLDYCESPGIWGDVLAAAVAANASISEAVNDFCFRRAWRQEGQDRIANGDRVNRDR